MNIQKAYNEWSASYNNDENLTRDLDQQVTRELLANLHFNSILEVGCGTGKNTAFLVQIATSVHSLDFSHGMIEKAKEKVPAKMSDFLSLTLQKSGLATMQNLISSSAILFWSTSKTFPSSSQKLPEFCKTREDFSSMSSILSNSMKGKRQGFIGKMKALAWAAFVHHISDFTNAAQANGLRLVNLNEYWHAADQNKPPRLISFMFMKA